MIATDSKTMFTYYMHALKAILPQDSHLRELEQMILDVKAEKPKESILFSGTRLRCEELDEKLKKLLSKVLETKYHFRDDVYDVMNEVRCHEQLLCELEEYIEADLPAKEDFLLNNCTQMRKQIHLMMNILKAQFKITFDEISQANFVLGPYHRNLSHAKKYLKSLKIAIHSNGGNSIQDEINGNLESLDALIANAEEVDFNFDPTAFNYGRELLQEEKTRIIDEWKYIMRHVRSIKRAINGLSPYPTTPISSHSIDCIPPPFVL